MRTKPIGIFDSGIGGISVYRQIRSLLSAESIIYFADQNNIPYGSKDPESVYLYALKITEFLILKGCKIIVIACNTACAAALHALRKVFPDTVFVGMEPAVKPAALLSKSKAVGVLATEGTFKGVPYAGVLQRFARGVRVYEQACNGLAEAIEAEKDSVEIRDMLVEWIEPLKRNNVDQLALACTHYPLVIDLIKSVAGSGINVIDPAEAIARRVRSLILQNDWASLGSACVRFFTTADREKLLPSVVRQEFASVNYCCWGEDKCLVEL